MTPLPDTDPRIQPLLEWNRLARQNAENAIVSSMFEAGFKSSAPIEAFSTWLLVGGATVAAFLIANADKLVPIIGNEGFFVCGSLLCLSCALGMLARVLALKCKIQIQTGAAVRRTFAKHLARHSEEKEKIEKGAAIWGITLETGVRQERILEEFFAPMPKWLQWLTKRQLKKYEGNPQVAHLMVIKSMQWQALYAALQALAFFSFLVAGFIYAATMPTHHADTHSGTAVCKRAESSNDSGDQK